MRTIIRGICWAWLLLWAGQVGATFAQEAANSAAQSALAAEPSPRAIPWRTDYRPAMAEAKAAGKLLLLWFVDPTQSATNEAFEQALLADPTICSRLGDYVTAKLPRQATVLLEGKPVELLQHPAFAEMQGCPGLAMIDQRDPQSPHFGRVVSIYPFTHGPIALDRLAVLLDLPTGTLTQRTLIFAVRTHPDRPQSAWSGVSPLLAEETEKHSRYQAAIHLQGHHRWDQRFHAINARLPDGLTANEVCAESWPRQSLVEAAEECVDCWRQSAGHWDHVRRRHALFGYDMHRGRNGIWYATGIFATRQ